MFLNYSNNSWQKEKWQDIILWEKSDHKWMTCSKWEWISLQYLAGRYAMTLEEEHDLNRGDIKYTWRNSVKYPKWMTNIRHFYIFHLKPWDLSKSEMYTNYQNFLEYWLNHHCLNNLFFTYDNMFPNISLFCKSNSFNIQKLVCFFLSQNFLNVKILQVFNNRVSKLILHNYFNNDHSQYYAF